MANTTHPIKSYTFADTTPVNLGLTVLNLAPSSTAGVGACIWFGFQNQSDNDILLLESASATKGVIVKAGDLYRSPIFDGNANGYDVYEYWLKLTATATNNDVVVERKIG